ncbi:hypothetical protein J1N35_022963 [Gossypium stocksii]|uniref:NB-ARC domain-containing protein n=1 Tax=Gossypium stocksii TaxID=47602 RepID=A0A9D3VIS9_9ROSI|nr:hypothetical protein J1N35_022963 [Gossypium stocksii]
MAESFLSIIAETLLNNIISPSIKQTISRLNASDWKRLEETMTYIKAVLLDAEKLQQHNQTLRLSLTKLRGVFYDAEDVVDEFRCDALRKELKTVRFSSISIPFAYSLRMGHKIKKINERLETIATDFKRFNLGENVQILQNRPYVVPSHRDTHSLMTFKVLGRDQVKENIVDLLVQPRGVETMTVIPIVGIGGLGKTTLAQFVYNDERVSRSFPLKLWVCVSERFDVARLLCEIIFYISGERCDGLPVNALFTRLQSLIEGKKILLILDDVWNEDRVKWDELKAILMKLDYLHQSKIIVTTRSLTVASIMGTQNPVELEALSHEDSLSLLLKWAFNQGDEERYPNLLRIADEIVKKCKGVPLAVRTMGSLLYGKTRQRDWELIKDNHIWKLDQQETGILAALRLSYNHLPDHLKRCLAYLSLFPKDTLYDTDYIIQFWLANGFLQSPLQEDDVYCEDIGLQYFKDLWSNGFVQDVQDKVTYYYFKIHDLIHDLALSVSQEECLTIYQQTISASENSEYVRHLAFVERYPMRTLQPFLKKLKGVRTLVVNLIPEAHRREVEKTFLSACISNFKYLRLIDLDHCTLKALPKSICTLKHLKYLNLSRCQDLRRVPKSIHKLQSLLTLRLFDLPRFQVSDNLQRLVNLRFLELSGDDMQLREVRPGNWSSLRFLYFFKCTTLKCLLEGMENLTSLKDLIFKYCHELESLPRSLKFLVKLEDIFIISCRKINLLMEPQGIEDQNLHLGLKNFIIRDAPSLRDLPRLLLEASASHLEFIEIRGCPELEALPNWFQNLISLQRLEIIDCPKLSRLFDGVEHLTSLKQLKIQQCPTLSDKYRPQAGTDWSKISHIQEVHIEDQKIIKSR